jgi:predicted GIY-YIG superfamily endonuclease
MATNVYALRLQSDKYYIGKSADIDHRTTIHFNGKGSAFTKLYNPIGLIEVYNDVPHSFENELTKKFMRKYGINNVRGGAYCEPLLSLEKIRFIQQEFWAEDDLCIRCGRDSHWVSNCYAKTDVYGDLLETNMFINLIQSVWNYYTL